LVVVAFGFGAGLSVVSPCSGEGISATTASWVAGLLLVLVAMIGSTLGGYITDRLRRRHVNSPCGTRAARLR
jgi:hypothetical protein